MYHCYLTVLSLILTACCSDRLAVVGVACGLAPVGRWCLASYPVTNPLGEVGRSAKQLKEANRSGWPLSVLLQCICIACGVGRCVGGQCHSGRVGHGSLNHSSHGWSGGQ